MRSTRSIAIAAVLALSVAPAALAAPTQLAFGTIPVGSTSSSTCFVLCWGGTTGCVNSTAGTFTLNDPALAPFSIQNLRRHTSPPNTAADCTGTPVSGFPVSLAANQALVLEFQFAPTHGGTYSDLVDISGLQWNLTGSAPGGGGGGCVANATTLCIDDQTGDKRYEIRVHYSSPDRGYSGDGTAVPLAPSGIAKGGAFAFFSVENPELLIKVLDACAAPYLKHWVFYAAVTDVGFTVTVRDTVNGTVKTYTNADHHVAAPLQDTSTFGC